MTAAGPAPLLEVKGLRMHFPVTEGVFTRRKIGEVKAVDGVDFAMRRGENAQLGISRERLDERRSAGLRRRRHLMAPPLMRDFVRDALRHDIHAIRIRPVREKRTILRHKDHPRKREAGEARRV